MSWVVDNAEPLLDFERPTLHKVVHVGGLSVHKPKPLNKWDDILNRRSHTVLISFGSVARSALMPDPMKKTVLDVIKSYPNITFIWKYEEPDDKMFKAIGNVIPTKWMPQGDLLADNRLTLFVTHGGVNSMMETATLGKPVITIPLFADQSKNAKLMQKYGFGM
ncbi:unnamed protein product [Haemonchus placei]|uniref:UDP-glucuronosyltransferase n=1 Tax=Haemonchus placei TaxID=6290 RepID=A0A0N4VY86_HAEPC|nr:unnamed protein product [Haemonchus placei]